MLTINLEALGVSEQSLAQAILKEAGVTPEEAIQEIAESLGVKLPQAVAPVATGDSVATTQGESRAIVITEEDAQALKRTAELLNRAFA